MSTKTKNKQETKTASKTTQVKKGRGRPKSDKPKAEVKVTQVKTRFNDIIGTVKKEGEFTFAESHDKVAEGYVRIVKYEDTTVKVFDKDDYEITPAKATICRAVAILSNFDETEYTAYSKKSTTRSAGARLLKLLSDQAKQVEKVEVEEETVVEEGE